MKNVSLFIVMLLFLTQVSSAVWYRYEAEDGTPIDTVIFLEDQDASGGEYVQLEKEAGRFPGEIVMYVNVREEGEYPMRFAQGTGPDETERHEDVRVNGMQYCEEQYWCNYTYAMELVDAGDYPPTSNWTPAQFAEFMSYIDPDEDVYGDANWQIVDRWGPAWGELQTKNDLMEVYLNPGVNTISVRAEWGWTTLDYMELDLPAMATDPDPADLGEAKTTKAKLSWTNPMPGLHHVDVWFGDPNSSITVTPENYQLVLTKIDTIYDPKERESTDMPTLVNLTKYTWAVDGFESTDSEDPNTFLGVFWTFTANDNDPPDVDAGDDQYLWLGQHGVEGQATLTTEAIVTDDGLPPDAELTYLWEQIAGPEVTIASPADENITLILDELANNNEEETAEPYQFQLTVGDTDKEASDIVTVTLSTDSCLASHEIPDSEYHLGDVNRDCKVDITDFYEVALNWLGCTNTLAGCE
jgi:hypothetical protein